MIDNILKNEFSKSNDVLNNLEGCYCECWCWFWDTQEEGMIMWDRDLSGGGPQE